MIAITFPGPIPSKKNQWSPGAKGKGIVIRRGLRAELDRLTLLAQSQWRGRPPLVHPNITFRFAVSNQQQDRDNMATTLLDVLVKARVLEDDSIARCNGRVVHDPAEIVAKGQESAAVLLWE